MKRNLVLIIIIFIIIILFLFVALKNAEAKERDIKKANFEYEQYTNREISGVELTTIINMAMNNNEKNKVEKNEDGFYIEDNNSIKIAIHIKTNDTTYQMETIYSHGMNQFIQNFNSVTFKATDVEYNEATEKISKIVFEQIDA